MNEYMLFSEPYLAHVGRSKIDGAPVGSGRYRRDSGENPQAAKREKEVAKRAAKLKKKADKQAAKEKKAQMEAEEYERARTRAIRSGNPEEIKKFQYELTNEELKQAITRIDQMKSLGVDNAKTTAQKIGAGMDKIDAVMKRVGQVSDWIGTANKLYANVNIASKNYNKFQQQQQTDSKPKGTANDNKKNKSHDRSSKSGPEVSSPSGGQSNTARQNPSSSGGTDKKVYYGTVETVRPPRQSTGNSRTNSGRGVVIDIVTDLATKPVPMSYPALPPSPYYPDPRRR